MNKREIYRLEVYYVSGEYVCDVFDVLYVENIELLNKYLNGDLFYLDLFEHLGYVFSNIGLFLDINNLNFNNERVLFYKNCIINYKRIQKLNELNESI